MSDVPRVDKGFRFSDEEHAAIQDELRDLWHTALEREGNLASAVADVVWKATPYGTTDDGDVYAYIVPKGAMHRLAGVAQSNGAHVPVAFRATQTWNADS